MLSGMQETDAEYDGMIHADIDTSALVEALCAAVAHHWPNANDVSELARQHVGKRVTLVRRGRNAAGVTVISTASATLRTNAEGPFYVLREAGRKGYAIDEVIIDIMSGWDQEARVIEAIRARALELAPEDLGEVAGVDQLRAGAGSMRLWGSLERRDGAAIPGALWTISEYDADVDTLRGTYVTPSSSQPRPMSGKASEVAGWAVGATAA